MKYGVWKALSFFLLLTSLFVLPTFASASVTLGTANLTSLTSGLVAYYPLDGATTNWTTNKTNDVSGQGNTGQMISMSTTTSPVPGKIGQALSFNGTNSYINIGNPSSLNNFNNFTISAWVKAPSFLAGTDAVVTRRSGGGGLSMGIAYGLCSAVTLDVGEGGAAVICGNRVLAANTWYHLVLVMSGTTVTGYVNGVQDFSASDTWTWTSGNPISIGAQNSGTGHLYTGIIDDIRIYNRALSPQEVALLYAAGQAHVETANTVSLTSGLVGYWPLDGATTNWAKNQTSDLSGNGNTGKFVGMSTTTSPVAGKVGQALNFNASTSYITVPNASSLGAASAITISVWVKPTGTGASADGVIIEKGTYSSANYGLSVYHANAINLIGFGSGIVGASKNIWDGKWHHIVGIINGSSGSEYVDGALIATGALSLTTNSNPLTIGSRAGASSFFNGTIDDVRIYNRALSPQEVAQLYALGTANIAHSNTVTLSTGLVGYWTFNGGDINWATNKMVDASGNGNTGTLVSMSTTTSPVPGKIGQALKFTGSNYITAASASSLNLSGSATISAWVKLNALGVSTNAIVGKWAGTNQSYKIAVLSTGKFYIDVTNSGTGDNYLQSGVTLSTGTWYHVVGVYTSGASPSLNVYVNGTLSNGVLTGTVPSSLFVGAAPVTVGSDGSNYFNGTIDDVRIYNRALSAQEVQQLYLMGK